MDFFAKLADNRIREAIEAGEFNDLQGKGHPSTWMMTAIFLLTCAWPIRS